MFISLMPGIPHAATADYPEEMIAMAAMDDLADDELLRLFRENTEGSERRALACEVLVERYTRLVRSCVRQYLGSPEPAEDLMQVGYVGLLKAINNFDPSFGGSLSGYAVPCVTGEIKRHFRDKRWQVHVRRSAQELMLEVRKATEQLTHSLGRAPSEEELAERLGISLTDVAEARHADLAFTAFSLDAPVSDGNDPVLLGELLGDYDDAMDRMVDLTALEAHWVELPEREQRILTMRFYGNLTQSEIGKHLGISQMHVSRLQSRALAHLRERVLGDPAGSAR
jgi:RNA polymerase sigma-B factor